MSAYFEVTIRLLDVENRNKNLEIFSAKLISLPIHKVTELITQPALEEDMQDADTVMNAFYRQEETNPL